MNAIQSSNDNARTTGRAALTFAALFLGVFALNTVYAIIAPATERPDFTVMRGEFMYGVVFSLAWAALGVALITTAVAAERLVWPTRTTTGRVATSLGVLAGAGFLFGAAGTFTQRGPLGDNILALGLTPGTQSALVELSFQLVHAGGYLTALGLAVWLGLLAVAGVRNGRLPVVAVVCAWVAGLAPLLGYAVTGWQYGLLLTCPALALFGWAVLRRERAVAEVHTEHAVPAPSER